MSQFYGVLKGARGEATRCGSRKSGITVTAASWNGAITVSINEDAQGNEVFTVSRHPWQGRGALVGLLAHGVLNEDTKP